ncbi:MAG: ABC transporter substrate-binding protein [Anaerolineae bacterium]|nr:ABC transporter substrate-binding protein [Anaerolineae bacterium]
MKTRFLVLLVLLAALVGVMPSLAQTPDAETLVITSLSDLQSFDPHIGYDTVTWFTYPLVYRGLVGLDSSGEPSPELAESWTISEDGMTYTFVLRDGIMFSNGRAITAEDIKYSFTRLQSPDTASPTAYMFDMVEGTAEYIAGDATEISGITVVDEKTVEFKLARPEWTLMKRFALPPGMIVAREQVEGAENFAREPLGAGPFVLDSWESGVRLSFSANPNYWRESPAYSKVVIDLAIDPTVGALRIESGEADLMVDPISNSDYPRVATDPALAENLVLSVGFPNTQYIIPNVRQGPFSDLRVREALNIAIDRERLVTIYNNRAIPAAGPVPNNVDGDNADLSVPFDPERAKTLLAEAGFADGFSVSVLLTTDPVDSAVMQAVAEDWAAVGVTLELRPVEFAQWLDVAYSSPEEVDLFYIGWFMDYLDPSNVFEPLLTCAGSFNPGAYCNADIDAAFAATKELPPGDARWQAFSDLEALAVADVANMYLVHVQQYFYHSARLDNVTAHPASQIDLDAITFK